MSDLLKLAERVVDAIIGATIDAIDDRNSTQGRFANDAAESRATAIEIVEHALRARAAQPDEATPPEEIR